MKVWELKEYLNNMSKDYDDFDSWDIYTEDERLAIVNDEEISRMEQMGYEFSEMLHDALMENDRCKAILKQERNAGWKFLEGRDASYNLYYKDIAGGVSSVPEHKAICFNINY